MPNTSDQLTRHAHDLQRFANGEVKKFLPFLRRAADLMRAELLKTNTVNSQKRIKAKLDYIEQVIINEFTGYTDEITKQLELFAGVEVEFAGGALIVDGVVLETALPSAAQVFAAVTARPFNNRLLKDYLKGFATEQAKAVRNAISTGFLEGRTTQEIVSSVVGTKSQGYKNGLLNVSRTSAERMVRTALNHTASVAQDMTWKENADVVPYYKWSSTLDSRTSPLCQKLDGTIYKTGKGRLPPAHYNCRSITVPMFKNEVDPKTLKAKPSQIKGDTRASVDGQVSADLNYNDWLKQQTKQFQIEQLGEAKAELFRKGGLSVDKFVNNADQTLTLDQLKARFPTAWEKAEL